jgi:hypothetical protein
MSDQKPPLSDRLQPWAEMDHPWIPGAEADLIKELYVFVFNVEMREAGIRALHTKEQFGDCVEDGEEYPCPTIKVLDYNALEVPRVD